MFPSPRISQSAVIHRVKGFSEVSEAEVDAFPELSCFFYDPVNVGNLISGSSAFSKSSLNPRAPRNNSLWDPGPTGGRCPVPTEAGLFWEDWSPLVVGEPRLWHHVETVCPPERLRAPLSLPRDPPLRHPLPPPRCTGLAPNRYSVQAQRKRGG